MSLKENLKSLKLNESAISMVIGVVVIVVVGILVIRYFRSIDDSATLPPVSTEEEAEEGSITIDEEGRKVYVVASGDTLWLIAQKQYGSGFNWAQIAAANNLENPGDIEEGQEIIIPEIESEDADDSLAMEESETEEEPIIDVEVTIEEVEDESEPEATEEPLPTMDVEVENTDENDDSSEEVSEDASETESDISGSKYVVVQGDSLWTIAERAYGDGTKWVMLAEENELVNPHLIHAGNEFSLPR